MATETATDGDAGAGDHMVVDCYGRYIGELEDVTEVDVFLGAGLTMVGLVLAVAGWGTLADAEAAVGVGPGFWTFREAAVIVAGIGVPVFMLGVVRMLVGNDTITAISLAGVAVRLVGVVAFTVAYPTAGTSRRRSTTSSRASPSTASASSGSRSPPARRSAVESPSDRAGPDGSRRSLVPPGRDRRAHDPGGVAVGTRQE